MNLLGTDYPPTAFEALALEEETIGESSRSLYLVRHGSGFRVIAGEETSASGDGFERLMAQHPKRWRR